MLHHSLSGRKIHLIGIKGTGMATLALWLHSEGARVQGSDLEQHFYTDELLAAEGIRYYQGFDPAHMDTSIDGVVYSQAYDQRNSELARAQQLGLPLLSYPQALGQISARFPLALAVVGVHGKTTSTLLLGNMLQALGLSATVWAGGSNPAWQQRPLWLGGSSILVAEACEYRRHFLSFSANALLLLSLDWDHQDYYPSYADLEQAFAELICQLPTHAPLIYNADDPRVATLVASLPRTQPLTLLPFGSKAPPPFTISSKQLSPGCNTLAMAEGAHPFPFHLPGEHLLQNAAGVIAAATALWQLQHPRPPRTREQAQARFADGVCRREKLGKAQLPWQTLAQVTKNYRGATRRSEVLGQAGQVIFIDDYAHHPTAIAATLHGFRLFYPDRRLVVDFIAHTYSRTRALWQEFSHCFADADILFLHEIYASAREGMAEKVDSSSFADAISAQRSPNSTYFMPHPDADQIVRILRPGDLFVSLGAGNNRQLALSCLARLKQHGACGQTGGFFA